VKEAVLAYFFLLAEKRPLEKAELDTIIEKWLENGMISSHRPAQMTLSEVDRYNESDFPWTHAHPAESVDRKKR
jgi:hypothetical protein